MSGEMKNDDDNIKHLASGEEQGVNDYSDDPMAQFESSNQSSSLNWPSPDDDDDEVDHHHSPSAHPDESVSAAPKQKIELVNDDEQRGESGPSFSATPEQDEAQFDPAEMLTKPADEADPDLVPAKKEKRRLFGGKDKSSKPPKEKPVRARRSKQKADNDDGEDERRGGIAIGKVAWGVTKVLGTGALFGVVYLLAADVNNLKQMQTQSASHIREQVIAEMTALESRVLESSGQMLTDIKTVSNDLQVLRDAAKDREEKLQQLIADMESKGSNSAEVEALRKMVEVNRSVISKMDANMEQMKQNVEELEKKATNIVVSKRVSPKPANPPAPSKINRTVSSIEGYSLFSVDLWGGTPLLVLVKGDEIKRVKKGDDVAGWTVNHIDSYKNQAVLTKGNVTSTLRG